MTALREIQVGARDVRRFGPLLGEEAVAHAEETAGRLRERLGSRVLWNVNSTAVGGGVAEMLYPLLGYARGAGVDARWLVIGGSQAFFGLTKRLHHALHGSPGDGRPLDDEALRLYQTSLQAEAAELCAVVRPGDVVILHDPQTAGLAPELVRGGCTTLWRCHVGEDRPGEEARRGWRFLRPFLRDVPALVFSRPAHVPDWCDERRVAIIPPSIDPFSPKNQALSPEASLAMLVHAGLLRGPEPPDELLAFERADGTPGRVTRRADIVRHGQAPAPEAPLVVQVSRWDPLKDHEGVLRGFAVAGDGSSPAGAELLLVGPNARAVADDPEAPAVLESVLASWRALPHGVRDRVHVATLPTADVEENAVLVNAIQRHAAVVVQKSLREGFGLTVTEAMWKGRAVLASAVGGIQDQVVDGESGVLLEEPRDVEAFASALAALLEGPALRERLGRAARARVRERYLGVRHLLDYARLLERLDA